ncbi:MAG: histidine kinase [Bacteroidia bacterium]|nr:histidine kinase [Bacteroidia bacterium]
MKKWVLIGPLLLLSTLRLTAQDPQYFNYGIGEGLPSNQIYELETNRDGHLWLGTDRGLVRFDGTHFAQLRAPRNEETGITQLFEHEKTGMYCRTFDGRLFLARGDSLLPLPVFSGLVDYRILGDRLYYLTASKMVEADLLGRNPKVLLEADRRHQLLYILNDSVVMSNYAVFQVKTGAQTALPPGNWMRYSVAGAVWLSRIGDSQPFQVDKNLQLQQFPVMPPHFRTNCQITKVLPTNQGYYFGSFCGVFTPKNTAPFFSKHVVTDIEIDIEGNYWFSTLGDGLMLVPQIEVLEYRRGAGVFQTRPDKIVTDSQGNAYIWGVGTIYRIRAGQQQMERLHELPTKKECQVAWLNEAENTIYFESGGFYEWNLDHAERAPRRIGDMNIKSIAATPAGFLTRTWKFFTILRNQENLPLPNHWFSNYLGAEIARQGAYTTNVIAGPNLPNEGAQVCTYDAVGDRVLLGYLKQSFLLSQTGVENVELDGQPLRLTAVTAHEGSIYMAAKHEGIVQLRPDKVVIRLLDPAYFDHHSVIQMRIHAGSLWLLLADRLISIRLDGEHLTRPIHTHATGNYEYRDLNFAAQTIWIATNQGLLNIPLALNVIDTIAPRLQGVQILNGTTEVDTRSPSEFDHRDNAFIVKLQGIHFKSRGKYWFKVQLADYEKEAQTVFPQNPVLQYKGLPPGTYTLHIYAQNFDGFRSPTFEYAFTILAPFWQKAWFYLLLVFFAGFCAFGVAKLYARYLRRRNLMQMQLVESKLTSLKAQMNPHFIFNALGSIQFLVLKGEILHANTYLGKFSRLMRMVLEMSELKAITLNEEIQSLTLYLELEKLRMGERFLYKIQIESGIQLDSIKLPPSLIQPYVENAIRHGLLHKEGEKTLQINFSFDKNIDTLICSIDDNGIGRAASSKLREGSHRSFSSQAGTNRLNLYNRLYPGYFNIKFHDKAADAGTKVEITLPMHFEG